MPGTTGPGRPVAGTGGTGVRNPEYGQASDPETGEPGPEAEGSGLGAEDPGRQGPGPEGMVRQASEAVRRVLETDRPEAGADRPEAGADRGPGTGSGPVSEGTGRVPAPAQALVPALVPVPVARDR
ncbi:hypothetical protein Psi01_22970 [Planobispora siamensis]|uniref:Uncharacterized protein n=1 Tax=Planobispora siamensis TaxID=936338 RepID=A0A8J3WKJ6_9ACTN|nr:hypothetical protein Psi01_22970 [Planobispora siamensis]